MRIALISCLALLLAGCSNGDPAQPAAEAAPDSVGTTPDDTAVADDNAISVPANSQTGSPGMVECNVDADCHRDVTGSGGSTVTAQLVGASCHFSNYQPVCECQLLRPPSAGQDSHVFTALPGYRPGGCSEYTLVPGCLYCESEFPGCNIDEPTSCDAVCADFVARANQESARPISARERLARCVENRCQRLYEIDGKCYVGEPWRPEARGYDCSLSDDELLAKSELATEPSCAARPAVSCASASDCPGGLGCKDGVCAPCDQICSAGSSSGDEASCTGGGACASGESCVASLCVLDGAVTCRGDSDCGYDRQCGASAVDWTSGRGNEHTRTFCAGAR